KLFNDEYLRYMYTTGSIYNTPAIKLDNSPIPIVVEPETKTRSIFFNNSTTIPATGPKIIPLINAGISLKSSFRKFADGSKGNSSNIRMYEILPNIATITILLILLLAFILNLSFSRSSHRRTEGVLV